MWHALLHICVGTPDCSHAYSPSTRSLQHTPVYNLIFQEKKNSSNSSPPNREQLCLHTDHNQTPIDLIARRSRHLHPRRLLAAPSNLAVRSDQPLSTSSHQPPSIQTPRLDGSLLIAAHWTVRATHSKFPTPPIEMSIAAVLHLAPCPSPDTSVQALHGVEHTIAPPLWSWL
jgi:hypothetical protein